MKDNISTKKLGDCLMQFDRGISWSRRDEGGDIAVLRIPNVQEGYINLDDLKHISAKNGNGELDKNDIVMVASNGNPDLVGRSAIVTEKEKGMRFASFLIRLRFDNTKLLSQYAHLFLLTPTFKRELRRKIATTSGIYNLKKEHIEKIKIPLPPLGTQKHIVERLDKIAEAQKLNDDLIQKTDELFQSLLHQELNPAGKNWEVKKLKDICEELFAGGDVPKNNFSKTKTERYSVPIFANGIEGKDLYGYTGIKKVIKPAITISARGTIGYPVIRTEAFYPIVRLIVLIPNSKIINLNFLYYSTYNFNFFNTGTSIPQLTIPMVERVRISLPPLETQKQIVAKLSAVQDYKTQLLAQKSKLKELFDSALAKSMTN